MGYVCQPDRSNTIDFRECFTPDFFTILNVTISNSHLVKEKNRYWWIEIVIGTCCDSVTVLLDDHWEATGREERARRCVLTLFSSGLFLKATELSNQIWRPTFVETPIPSPKKPLQTKPHFPLRPRPLVRSCSNRNIPEEDHLWDFRDLA